MIKTLKAVITTVAILSIISFVSCATKFKQEEFDLAYSDGNYDSCITMLVNRKTDPLLNDLDTAMLQFMKKDYLESAKELVDTQLYMQQLVKDMTVLKTLSAVFGGENSIEYAGSTYERLLAFSMKAINAHKMGEVDRAIGVFNEYTGTYKDEIINFLNQEKEALTASEQSDNSQETKNSLNILKGYGYQIDLTSFRKPAKPNAIYENSPMLAYLGALTYIVNKDLTHAKEFEKIFKTLNNNYDISRDIEIPSGKGRISILALSDTIGRKSDSAEHTQLTKFSPTNGIGLPEIVIKIVYPEFIESKQNHKIDVVSAKLSGDSNNESTFELIEDFDNAVKLDVASKARAAYSRSLARNIIKNATAVTAGLTAYTYAQKIKNDKNSTELQKSFAELSATLAITGINIALTKFIENEKSDIRQALYFPHTAKATGFTVTPGNYKVTVKFSNGEEFIQDVEVKAGESTFIIADCMNPMKKI